MSMVVELSSRGFPLQSTIQLSIFAHAAVMNLITSADSNLGRRLHDCKRYKPVSLAVLSAQPRNITLRVAFLGKDGMQVVFGQVISEFKQNHAEVTFILRGIHGGAEKLAHELHADFVAKLSKYTSASLFL